MKNLIIFASLSLLLSACGWQLRGFTGKARHSQPERLHLVVEDSKAPLAKSIKQQMVRMKIADTVNAKLALVIEKEEVDRRPLAVTDTGVTAQYQLIYTVHYHYEDKAAEFALPSRKVVSWRSYDFDAQLIVSKAQEELALLDEMREELSQRILGLSI